MLHEDHFFELQGSLTVEVEFIVTEGEAQQLIERVSRERVRAVYALMPVRFGVIGKADAAGKAGGAVPGA